MGVRGGRGGAEGETRRKRRNTEDDTRLIPVRKFWKYQADTSPEKKKWVGKCRGAPGGKPG